MKNKKLKVALMVAMDKELELMTVHRKPFVKKIGKIEFYEIYDYSDDVDLIVVKSGIGKVNAASATTALILIYNPDIIISSGVCGSVMKENVNQGDIHISSIIKYHDVWCGTPNELGQVQDMPARYHSLTNGDMDFINKIKNEMESDERKVRYGLTLSGDWFVDTEDKAMELLSNSVLFGEEPSVCVDMESGAIAQVAYSFGTRFVSVRIVSDAILNKECKKYEEFWSNAGNTLHKLSETIIKNVGMLLN